MLGRTRRTTRTDVSLALVMAGFVYLAWALACWTAAESAESIRQAGGVNPSGLDGWLAATFGGWARHLFDVIGPVWLLAALYMVIRASRQRRIISWSWLLVSCQAIAAILIGCWAAAGHVLVATTSPAQAGFESRFQADTLPVVVGAGVVIWLGALVWLITMRLRLRHMRGGVGVGDGLKTHVYRR